MRATNDKINARTGRPILLAIIVGVALGAALLVSLLIIKGLFVIFAGALIIVASLELATALRVAGRHVPRVPIIIGAVLVVPASFYTVALIAGLSNEAGHWLFSLVAVALVVVWRLVEQLVPSRRVAASSLVRDLGAGAFIVLYTVFLPSFFVLLVSHENGQWWTLAALIVVVCVDTGAYASGLAFGKNKMVPSISPNKTWEGFAGSVAAAVVAGILLALLASEILAVTGKTPSVLYAELVEQFGDPAYERIDAVATKEQKARLGKLSGDAVTATELAGDPITARLSEAPGNGAAIGGLKVTTEHAWFAARPSGTEDVYKIYAESFKGPEHLKLVQAEAKAIVDAALAG